MPPEVAPPTSIVESVIGVFASPSFIITGTVVLADLDGGRIVGRRTGTNRVRTNHYQRAFRFPAFR